MAIITEAIHSAIDLIASIVAYFSVRQAETPADASHRYGHEKFENVAAGVEGMLILVGSGVIVYTAVDHLVEGTEIESLGFGIAVVAFATVVNLDRLAVPLPPRRGDRLRRARRRRRPPAHRRDAPRSACSSASCSSRSPARRGSTRSSRS